ncbi:MAG: thioesterase family protein [Pseudomonadota bacterium]
MHDPLHAAVLAGFNAAPFNALLGLRIDSLSADRCTARFDMRPDLVGNTVHGILHGGVTSAVLDTVGGATATLGAWHRMADIDEAERIRRLGRLGTLDMRVDYLKPGRGEWFLATGTILRAGNKVMVTRMEMHNHEQLLIAAATGTYLY